MPYQSSFVIGESFGDFQFETDRMKFLGRYRNTESADVILTGKPLSGTVGAVLDPIFSQRRYLRVKPGETGRVIFLTGMENGVDIYTKGVLRYPTAVCSFKIGLGVKTEGNLIISGPKGYAYVEAP